MVHYALRNKPAAEHTASPDKYPQGRFNPKPCRWCSTEFKPKAPSHLYCGDLCARTAITDAYLRRNYDIGVAEYSAMLAAQDNKCALCFGPGFLMTPKHEIFLVVDHCHTTGKVRGLLCHNCNRALGLLKDDTQVMQRAIDYLEGATTIPQGSRAKRSEAHSPS